MFPISLLVKSAFILSKTCQNKTKKKLKEFSRFNRKREVIELMKIIKKNPHHDASFEFLLDLKSCTLCLLSSK